jgi:hypothetical protein
VSKIVKSEVGDKAVKRKASVDTIIQAFNEFRDSVNGTSGGSAKLAGTDDVKSLVYFNDRATSIMTSEQNKLAAQGYSDIAHIGISDAMKIENYKDTNPTTGEVKIKEMTLTIYQSVIEPLNSFSVNALKEDVANVKSAIKQSTNFLPSVENVVHIIVAHLDALWNC